MMRIIKWFLPGGLVLGLALAYVAGYGPAGLGESLTGTLPKVIFGFVVLLGAFFHRSRVVLFSLGLGLLQVVHDNDVGGPSGFFLVAGLFAGSAGLLGLSKDRGVFSLSGLFQVAAFLLMLSTGVLFVLVAPKDVSTFLSVRPFPSGISGWTELPQPVVFAFLLSLLASLVVAILRTGPVERGWFWSLLMVAMALGVTSDPGAVGVLLAGAGLTLGLALLETSYAMAYRDDLTGLPARRALMRDLAGISGSYSAAMVDVDHFKRFNDRYGHDVGDQVLRMVAARLARGPGGGKAYRYGGEEFTLLFPGKTLPEALPHLREVRKSVEEAVFTLRNWRRPRKKPVDPGAWRGAGKGKTTKRLSVTVSIGVADSGGADPSPESVLKRADRALYRAKKSGRNRVTK